MNTKRSITPLKELVSDVEGFIPERTHVASTNNKLFINRSRNEREVMPRYENPEREVHVNRDRC